jgi:RNA polymerase sigma-70 factor (ECF subfamily)
VFENDSDLDLADRSAQEAFVEASYAWLFRWFRRLTGSSDQAADLTQETFVEFWIAVDHRPVGVGPRIWLYAIGRNRWRKAARDRKGFEPVPCSVLPVGGRSAEQRAEDLEFRKAAEAAVTNLPADLREAFTLRFWDEFEYEDIGRIQGVTAGLARWRYFAARRRLHETLSAWDPHPRKAREERYAR